MQRVISVLAEPKATICMCRICCVECRRLSNVIRCNNWVR